MVANVKSVLESCDGVLGIAGQKNPETPADLSTDWKLLLLPQQRVNAYEAVNYNEHDESPEDHIAINLRAAWQKADNYYSKLDNSPAYYAATILHQMYKYYCDKAWAKKPDWLV
jgi:hypothetical protein